MSKFAVRKTEGSIGRLGCSEPWQRRRTVPIRSAVLFLSAAFWLVPLGLGASAAPPKLTTLFPPGAGRGQEVSVTAGGSFGHWPVKLWVHRPGIEVTAAGENGKLVVKVSADAVPGVYWIRLIDDEGASSLRPFLVGTLPELVESEPNDEWRKPQVLDKSDLTLNGRLQKAGDVDTFAVTLRKGQTLVASVEANRTLGSPLDASLEIVSQAGFVLARNDDYHDLDPQIVYAVPADGVYLVRVFGFPATPNSTIGFAGGDDFIYRLTMTTGGFIECAYPLAIARPAQGSAETQKLEFVGWNIPQNAPQPLVVLDEANDSATVWHPQLAGAAAVRLEPYATAVKSPPADDGAPQTLSVPFTVSGRLERARTPDTYRFQGQKGQALVVRAESRSLGFPLDPFLRLTDDLGKTVAEVDDSGGGRDAELAFTPSADGQYRIIIRDLNGNGGARHLYRLSAVAAAPSFNLKLATDSFVVTPGKPLEIPVTIERLGGFAGEIDIAAEGLPNGVACSAGKSASSGDSSKTVKLSLQATAGPAAGPFQIVGRSAGQTPLTRGAAPLPGLTATTTQLWLSVLKGN